MPQRRGRKRQRSEEAPAELWDQVAQPVNDVYDEDSNGTSSSSNGRQQHEHEIGGRWRGRSLVELIQLPGSRWKLQQWSKDVYRGRHLSNLKEHAYTWQTTDKCFAVAWLNFRTALWGTKDNKLLLMDLHTRQMSQLEQPALPPSTPRPPQRGNVYGRCGIHNITLNPSHTLLATGGDNPNDALLYSLPDLKPLKNYIGHQDWVFQACWLNDDYFVTGSRDGKLMVWHADFSDPSDLLTGTTPVHTKDTKMARCRDMGNCIELGKLAAVDPDTAFIKVYDTHTWRQTDKYSLPEQSEAMCCAMRHDTIAVGSWSKVCRFDPRMRFCARRVCEHEHLDTDGLRSIQLSGNYISCGGSSGTLSFLDMRMNDWLTCPIENDYSEPEELWLPRTLLSQKGYVDRSRFMHTTTWLTDPPLSIYCHAWDESGLRLLAGGGPLQFGLRGCYAALWQ